MAVIVALCVGYAVSVIRIGADAPKKEETPPMQSLPITNIVGFTAAV